MVTQGACPTASLGAEWHWWWWRAETFRRTAQERTHAAYYQTWTAGTLPWRSAPTTRSREGRACCAAVCRYQTPGSGYWIRLDGSIERSITVTREWGSRL